MLSSHRLWPSSCSFAVAFILSPGRACLSKGRARGARPQSEWAIERYAAGRRADRWARRVGSDRAWAVAARAHDGTQLARESDPAQHADAEQDRGRARDPRPNWA